MVLWRLFRHDIHLLFSRLNTPKVWPYLVMWREIWISWISCNFKRKVSKSVDIICKSLSFYLNKTSLCTLYSLVYPYLQYCASVWGSTCRSNLKRLITLQKRFIRIISNSPFNTHANPIFVSLRILKFEDIIKLQVGKVMYLYKNGLLPDCFNDMFLFNWTYILITLQVRTPSVCPTAGQM